MRGLVLAAVLVALSPVAMAEPLFPGFQFCAVDIRAPVIRICIVSWDEPQEKCTDIQVGVRVIDECFDDPDFPPSFPPDPPHIPTPLLATPNVQCVPEAGGASVRACVYTYGGPDEGCAEVHAFGVFRDSCWTLPFPTLP